MSEQNHSPPFSPTQRLSQWMGYTLEVRCPCSPRVVLLPVAYFEETATAASKTPLRPCGIAYVVVGRPRYIW